MNGASLLVAIWAEERIDRVVLEPRGASFSGRVEPLVKGDENFRPVALAAAPDGSVFVTDWASRDYANHGQGRLWRISAATGAKVSRTVASAAAAAAQVKHAAPSLKDLAAADPFVRSTAIAAFGAPEHRHELLAAFPKLTGTARANAAVALRRASTSLNRTAQLDDVKLLLSDADVEVRFVAMKWAGEAGSHGTWW